jgi:MFS transporter, DHA2 family, multidrug resistance protein
MTNELMLGSAPPERAGAAAGISETSAEFSGALGIALFGSIGVAIYRRMLAGAMPPSVSDAAARTALDTLGGAAEVAGQLPADVGAELLGAARDAFLSGLHLSAVISAGLSVLLAVFVFRRLYSVERH